MRIKTGKLVWEVGEDSWQSDISEKLHICEIPAHKRKFKSLNLPQRLTGDLDKYKHGVEVLSLRFQLEPGYYTFNLGYKEITVQKIHSGANAVDPIPRRDIPLFSWKGDLQADLLKKWKKEVEEQIDAENPGCSLVFKEVDEIGNQPFPALCLISFDGKEIGRLIVPHPRYTSRGKTTFELRNRMYSFVCMRGGKHAIEIRAVRVPGSSGPGDVWSRFATKEFLPVNTALREVEHPEVEHSLLKPHPGLVGLDFWGWETSRIYQRGGKEVDLNYMRNRVVKESYKWGANTVSFFNNIMSWEKDDPIKGGDKYPRYNNFMGDIVEPGKQQVRQKSVWGDKELQEFIEICHSHDFLHHWFWSAQYNEESKRKGLYSNVTAPEDWFANWYMKIGRDWSNILKNGWVKSVDSVGYESSGIGTSPRLIKFQNIQWKYNPGLTVDEAAHDINTGARRIIPGLSPGQFAFNSCAHACFNGHDDGKVPFFVGDPEYNENEFGREIEVYEADCRLGTWGNYGSTTSDWVLKQCHDFFRGNRGDRGAYSTGVWWLNEAPNMCPDELRVYVYGISQDPLKCAVASQLLFTGEGGVIEEKSRETGKKPSITVFTQPRYRYPAKSHIIQNNWLRLYIKPGEDGGDLVYDPEGSAHYDSNSINVKVASQFVRTVVKQGGIELSGKVQTTEKIVEPAGYKAILKTTVINTVEWLKTEIKEEKVFTIDNDYPCLRVRIDRKVPKYKGTIGTEIGCSGYDELVIGRKAHHGWKDFKKMPESIKLRDRRNVLPEMAIFFAGEMNEGRLEWYPGKRMIVWNKGTDTIELAVLIPGILYSDRELKEVRKAVFQPTRNIQVAGREEKKVRNKFNIPLVEVVKISNPDDSPYLVREKGWWMFRGAQVSQENKKIDYLKLYMQGREEVVIQSYGFIKGVVKPGWGCQYTVALKDIEKKGDRIRCTVEVLSVTSCIFAPRLQFSGKVKRVILNGEDWRYFDADIVFLPNKKGIYEIAVERGESEEPHLISTFGMVERASWKKETFLMETSLPEWTKKLRRGLYLTAAIKFEGRNVKQIKGAEIIRKESEGVIIRFKPGRVMMEFDQ